MWSCEFGLIKMLNIVDFVCNSKTKYSGLQLSLHGAFTTLSQYALRWHHFLSISLFQYGGQ